MKTFGQFQMQQPSRMPVDKYQPSWKTNPISIPERDWPNKYHTHAPRWLATDLRDGNQALIEPMDPQRKRMMFDLLVKLGYKEIEVGFPAASQTDYDFVRSLVEDDAVPEDVQISVLTQSRADLIERTVESLRGFARASVHLYNATSPIFREVVFKMDKSAVLNLAVTGTQQVMEAAQRILGEHTIFGYEYSPEIFIDTEIDYALEVCERVMDTWEVGADREIILNLPATVERTTPNLYADRIEWMSKNLSRREFVCLSAHPHNDRGTGVAAAELAMIAGIDRVEGCLFGQGERTGNVDLITLALNLFAQGIDPMVQIDNIDEVRRTVEYCTQMRVPERCPYAGDLVYTSFSGSHQDAIKKGFAARAEKLAKANGIDEAVVWELPYLPIDPKDLGRSYEAVVRVNSQSGKGGIAYLMKSAYHMDLPRRLQIELAQIVQKHAEVSGGEISAESLYHIFVDEYLPATPESGLKPWGRFSLQSSNISTEQDRCILQTSIMDAGKEKHLESFGNGPVDAFVAALNTLGVDVQVIDYAQHALGEGQDAEAASYVECEVGDQVLWGVGISGSTTTASFKAIISAVNRSLR